MRTQIFSSTTNQQTGFIFYTFLLFFLLFLFFSFLSFISLQSGFNPNKNIFQQKHKSNISFWPHETKATQNTKTHGNTKQTPKMDLVTANDARDSPGAVTNETITDDDTFRHHGNGQR